MKNSSIKKRVTLYYSLTLIIITTLILGVFILTSGIESTAVSKNTLLSVVQNSFDDVDYENDILEIDNDFNSYSKGVTLLVYSEDGDLIKGSVPADFPATTPLTPGDYQELKTAEDTWLVYDLYNTYDNGQGLWVRGIYAMDNVTSTVSSIIKIMLLVLPVLLILAIFAGFRITKRAFAPISQVTQSVNLINNGSDLSKRLPQGETKDELYYLTETLNQMLERLETAFKAEKAFSYDVSHELKTPISVILAECEYTLSENRAPEIYRESLATIDQQCKRTMSLIQQLLQLSRTINTEHILEKEDFDISMLCQSVVDQLSLLGSDKGVAVQSRIQPSLVYNGDETLIMRMLINLINNAIKYSKPSGGYVNVSLTGDEHIKIVVEDNGIGINQTDQKLIWGRFYKVDKSRKSEENSYGLGLSMVKWIVEAHGGNIVLESTPDVGSTFTVIL